MERPRVHQRLSFDRQRYEEVLARMESRCGPPVGANDRAAPRYHYPEPDIPMRVEHPQGGASQFLVYARNLSRHGISVLHNGFVHSDSKCQLLLPRCNEAPIAVVGEVRHCRLFSGSCHEIGIRFRSEVNPRDLIGPELEEIDAHRPPRKPKTTVKGTILVMESFAPDHLLLENHLSQAGLDTCLAETPGAGIDIVKTSRPDLILFGLSLCGSEGAATLRSIRQFGFDGPILVLTADTGACEAGATSVMTKPYNIDLLLAQVRVYLGGSDAQLSRHSTAADQPGMPPLITQYVDLVQRTVDQLERTYAAGHWRELREYCRQLKGSGCGYGFQDLTVLSMSVMQTLEADPLADATRKSIAQLVEYCRRLQATRPMRGAS